MNRYLVTYSAMSPALANTEIEVNDRDAAKIRSQISEALRNRKPLVFGRDWNYLSVMTREEVVVEADKFTVQSAEKTAFFYNVDAASPCAVILNVIHVKELEA
jgi:hypothetical protein